LIDIFLEEIAAVNLAKFRKVQSELGKFEGERKNLYYKKSFAEDSAERADLAENQLGKLRAKNRSTISASRASPAVNCSLK
jgi:hypothetical protein